MNLLPALCLAPLAKASELFGLSSPRRANTDGTSICIAEKSNIESETTFLLYNTETKQFNTILYQGIQNSIIFRNDTMIASGILNDQNVITKKKTDSYSVVYLKVSNVSPKEKIILVDMEYQGWKSLPFYTKE